MREWEGNSLDCGGREARVTLARVAQWPEAASAGGRAEKILAAVLVLSINYYLDLTQALVWWQQFYSHAQCFSKTIFSNSIGPLYYYIITS